VVELADTLDSKSGAVRRIGSNPILGTNFNKKGNAMDISTLIGKKIDKIRQYDDEVIFVCGNEAYNMYHMQDCCERVYIWDIIGDLESLVGSTVLSVYESGDDPADVDYIPHESYTWTIYTLVTDKGTVVIRWLGESNGYYSERVHFGITHVPMDMR
jgi:hypothetical protein